MNPVTTSLAFAGILVAGAIALIVVRCRGGVKKDWLPLLAWILLLLAIALLLLNVARDASAAV